MSEFIKSDDRRDESRRKRQECPRHGSLIGRRELMAAAPVALATACSHVRAPGTERLVSVVRAADYSVDLSGIVRTILVEHKVAVRGKRVLLKPNLVEFTSGTPVNTNSVFVAAVYDAFLSLGAAQVTIAEGPGHRRITMDLADSAGFFSAIRGFEKHFVDLNLDEVSSVRLTKPFSTLAGLYLPKTALDCELLVSLPKMKTHHWVGATLSMKNLFGLVPGGVYGWPKNVLHWAGIDECIADLHLLFPSQFCIVDGIDGMQGNGPILGTAKHAGLVVAGSHPPSVDTTCCQVMGINPSGIKYLDLVAQRTGWRVGDVRQIGERAQSVYTPFALPPGFEGLRLGKGALL
jgi:uncharacterized protein (DUF362 family)